MSEWWTYRLADFLLFSPGTYYRLFELHNNAVWPAQLVAALTGLAILALILFKPPRAGRTIAALLAAAWIFVGWTFLMARYADINFAATYFSWAFFAQAALLAASGVGFGRLQPSPSDTTLAGKIGIGLIAFALLAYPFLGALAGRKWSEVELFGIAPDPTALLTLGVLLAARRMPWELAIVPALWCIVTGATLWVMENPAAIVMPAAALLTLGLAATKSWQPRAG
jgi:hypothetical protein